MQGLSCLLRQYICTFCSVFHTPLPRVYPIVSTEVGTIQTAVKDWLGMDLTGDVIGALRVCDRAQALDRDWQNNGMVLVGTSAPAAVIGWGTQGFHRRKCRARVHL